MNRRQFFSAMGAAAAIVVTKPVVIAKPVMMVSDTFSPELVDMLNVVAFAYHGEAFSEHREHYRRKVRTILERAWNQRKRGL